MNVTRRLFAHMGCERFADRRYADNVGRFADTYNCIKTAFHNTDTDILARIVARMSTCRATLPKFCVGPNMG